jgi:hypothetical protein
MLKNMNVGNEKKRGLEYERKNIFRYLNKERRLILKYILHKYNSLSLVSPRNWLG